MREDDKFHTRFRHTETLVSVHLNKSFNRLKLQFQYI